MRRLATRLLAQRSDRVVRLVRRELPLLHSPAAALGADAVLRRDVLGKESVLHGPAFIREMASATKT